MNLKAARPDTWQSHPTESLRAEVVSKTRVALVLSVQANSWLEAYYVLAEGIQSLIGDPK